VTAADPRGHDWWEQACATDMDDALVSGVVAMLRYVHGGYPRIPRDPNHDLAVYGRVIPSTPPRSTR
jgi:hypothetical protein